MINQVESTVMIFPPGSGTKSIYECEAFGIPRPKIRWEGVNERTGSVQPLRNLSDEILIQDQPEMHEITSILTIFEGSDIFMPTCMAMNPSGAVQLRATDFTEIAVPTMTTNVAGTHHAYF